MKKLALLKKMISEINQDEKYQDTVFQTDDMFFVICDNQILAIDQDSISGYFFHEYSKKEVAEVERIEKELGLDDMVFLPCKGNLGCGLDDLLESYEIAGEEEKIHQVEKLIEVLSDEKSIFFNREGDFLSIYLYPELQGGIPYVHREWDHDESYYYDLDYSIGECDPLYDVIVEEAEVILPDEIEDYDDCAEQEDECDRWIEILSNIDRHILG